MQDVGFRSSPRAVRVGSKRWTHSRIGDRDRRMDVGVHAQEVTASGFGDADDVVRPSHVLVLLSEEVQSTPCLGQQLRNHVVDGHHATGGRMLAQPPWHVERVVHDVSRCRASATSHVVAEGPVGPGGTPNTESAGELVV